MLALGAGCTYDFDQYRDQTGSTNPDQDAARDSSGEVKPDQGNRDATTDASAAPDTSPMDSGGADVTVADMGGDTHTSDTGLADAGPGDAATDMSVEEDMGVVPDPALCGNNVIDPGELCDPCQACDDMNACTTDSSSGLRLYRSNRGCLMGREAKVSPSLSSPLCSVSSQHRWRWKA